MSDESRMTWGEPPLLGGSAFRGRAGLVVEFAPDQFMSWRMSGTHGEMTISRECEEVHAFELTRPLIRVPMRGVVSLTLGGFLDSRERAERPSWATHVAGEIEARRAIEGRS